MSLINAVNLTFERNTNYEQAHQLVYQAESLKYLSSDLYRDSKRFIYELLQNADDSSVEQAKVRVSLKLFGDILVVAHSGKAFDNRDVRGITGIGDGVKKNAPDKTGFKGIGFKSVFGQSELVTIFSEGEYFRFDASYQHEWKDKWGESMDAWEKQEDRKFEMPWQMIPIITDAQDISPAIQEYLTTGGWKVATIIVLKNAEEIKNAIIQLGLTANMFLFLKNIVALSIETDTITYIEIIETDEGRTSLIVNGEEKSMWLKHSVTLDVPDDTKRKLAEDKDVPEKLKLTSHVDITFAAKVIEGKLTMLEATERLLYAYLPTEEKGHNIPVLVNAAFYTVANRETLHQDSPFNEWLFSSIPLELVKWIAQLVGDKQYDAYDLLPGRLLLTDKLAKFYNESLDIALKNVAFVINSTDTLLKTNEAIIDFTQLSRTSFFEAQFIRTSTMGNGVRPNINIAPFVKEIGHRAKLKRAGVATFGWPEVPYVLAAAHFIAAHTLEKNKQLINHLKAVADNERINEVTEEVLKAWPFILNHKNELRSPKDVFFPAQGDTYDQASELSFIHPGLQEWLDAASEIKAWLEKLGVVEKSDLTFLEKTIIPKASTYITLENAVDTIRKIFNLYVKGDVNSIILGQLKDLQIMTMQGKLIPAKEGFLSTVYRPRLGLQSVLEEDIYISDTYIIDSTSVTKWKAFFLELGTNEGIDIITYEKRLDNATLLSYGVEETFITRPEHKYTWINSYWVKNIKNLSTLSLLKYTLTSFEFSTVFWQDVIGNTMPASLSKPATGYYGRDNKSSWTNGSEIGNYMKWYVSAIECLPTKMGTCLSAGQIFLNEAETVKLCSTYLPVFNGPDLSADWRAFFGFKPHLELSDYLLLLTRIAQDPSTSNKTSINRIYRYLLDHYSLWNDETIANVTTWAHDASLLTTDGAYVRASELKYYADGDYKIFGGAYQFIHLDGDARGHLNIENLLGLFNISVLRQNEFKLKASADLEGSTLKDKLREVIPYWAKWMESERQSGYEEMLYDLDSKFENLNIKEAKELHIIYGDDWDRKVPLHFHDGTLYVSKPWRLSKVMFLLPDKLCEIFPAKKYRNEISFLLNSTIQEIKEYFIELEIELPPIPEDEEIVEDEEDDATTQEGATSSGLDHDFTPKPKTDYERHWRESLARNKSLVEAYPSDPSKLMIAGLQQQKPGENLMIYHFSHIENAVSIIREGAIKSRRDAVFSDSAGSGIIAQTDAERKVFARFYFRPKTPTQYYIENLGRGQESIRKISGDPICPVPVFFVIPLEEAMEQDNWNVSIGSMASPQVEFGKDVGTIAKFDFDGVYKTIPEVGWDRFRIAAHQEFLVKDELNLEGTNFSLVVQDAYAKESLLAMLGDLADVYDPKIRIDSAFYNQENPRVQLDKTSQSLKASLTHPHNGSFILQHSALGEWEAITGFVNGQFNKNNWITTFANKDVAIQSDLQQTMYKIYYFYKGRSWLIHTNTSDYSFDISFVKVALEQWISSSDNDIDGLFIALKFHPEFFYWFGQPVGGPDNLTLEDHTRAVISIYLRYFAGKQKLFATEKEYLLCLALHDIGKPAAVSEGDRKQQHIKTLEIIKRQRDILPYSDESLSVMKTIIDADPIGQFLNTSENFTLGEAVTEGYKMKDQLEISGEDFIESLTIYYQCDAAGYPSLQKRLFLLDEDGSLAMLSGGQRLSFNEEYEQKFVEFLETLKLML
ncbi:DUF4433 domain-containing protein [Chryseobacterium herbae]|uniref:DUF4433 domain-containing protein n=1 Tax=Chryseobacterium herbae TaxID=2976476 RepID=A0ABT2IT83_9FLAO|nr:DUF4433 domain-containing protein [Chryseobacterium sp. pc1-10]MCT2561860.1 DUF4433 domain-containing protein [Chryseobacterium sp. pc1-10]